MAKVLSFAKALAGRWRTLDGHQATFANAAELFNSLLGPVEIHLAWMTAVAS
jgi:hypothetical protein